MTNQHHPCATPGCATPATAVICHGCTARLTAALRELATGPAQRMRTHQVRGVRKTTIDYLPGLIDDLDDTITRNTTDTGGIGILTRSTDPGLTYRADAARLAHNLRNAITTWARVLVDHNRPNLHANTIDTTGLAAWMARQPNRLSMLPAAGELVDELTDFTRRVRDTVDRAPDLVYIGPCDWPVAKDTTCGADLYGLLEELSARCRKCGAVYPLAARRDWLLARVAEQLATTEEITRALPTLLGEKVASSTIRRWVHEGKLTQYQPHAADTRRRPRYKIRDVIDLASSRTRKAS